ncbi:MAG: hypothetical protein KTR15_10015 [Phycisphaeraceae bacterium]|nr:hypothetical protein [Phycisphaeraceae bacterium]
MKALMLWLMIACLLVSMSLAGGCSLDEMISVDVPPNTRTHFRERLQTDVPPTLSLRDARILRSEGDRRIEASIKAQLADHAASNDALDAELADGAFIESLLGSAINTGIDTALPGLATVPGGAILTALLAGLGMWLAPRPGEGKRQAQQTKAAEDKGYDMGRDEVLGLLRNQT